MANNNKVLQYLEDIIYMKRHDDKEGLAALQREGEAESVTLKDVGFAFLSIVDDISTHIDTSQALTEMRLKAIISCLDPETQIKILDEFVEAEDDLFDGPEGEEETNGN